MISEQELLKRWVSLTQDKQKQVLDFMDFLYWQEVSNKGGLEERLQQIRTKIISYGQPVYSTSDKVQDNAPQG